MQTLLSSLLWLLSASVLALLPMNPQKAFGCDALCEAMHELSPYGDREIYAKVSEAAQRHADTIDPYTIVAIAFVESSLRQITSLSGRDVGLFQFATFETARRGIDERRLLIDVDYAFAEFAKLMREKRDMCAARYPKTWYACWHSKTPVYHLAYARRVERHARFLRDAAKKVAAVNEPSGADDLSHLSHELVQLQRFLHDINGAAPFRFFAVDVGETGDQQHGGARVLGKFLEFLKKAHAAATRHANIADNAIGLI